jgi:hypothetical protein
VFAGKLDESIVFPTAPIGPRHEHHDPTPGPERESTAGGLGLDLESRVHDRDTIRGIKHGVLARCILATFKPADVDNALKIQWAGTFLPEHRVGNPGGYTELSSRSTAAYTACARIELAVD